ncbi:hypothetical protein BN946_scf184480.g1 [Trametes cinnabarina]|uniref:CCHC-type domain-containing protein n=1 Tax=Pycnoporus cinnabarinus TaxID=5643 RepID=A0A060SZU8_PYCCI|nr:hypothetical protein BN946_scf184480.g1 [Trametes cinnabarina]
MNFDALVRAFVKRFQTTDLAAKYLTKIESLRQTGSAASYANQFLECLAYLDWTEETKLTQFNRGLKPDLLRALAIRKRESTLEKWIPVVVEADDNLYEIDQELRRRGIKPGQSSKTAQPKARDTRPPNPLPPSTSPSTIANPSSSTAVPMDVDAIRQSRPRGPLSEAEKERRRKNNLCFYCGEGGHTFKNCPKKNPTAPASRSAGKA